MWCVYKSTAQLLTVQSRAARAELYIHRHSELVLPCGAPQTQAKAQNIQVPQSKPPPAGHLHEQLQQVYQDITAELQNASKRRLVAEEELKALRAEMHGF